MATVYVPLFPGNIIMPDGTTNNVAAQFQDVISSGTPPSSAPKLVFPQMLFNGTTGWHVIFKAPLLGYVSGGTLKASCARVTGTAAADVVLKAAVAALTPGAGEVPNTKAFSTVATATVAVGTVSQALVLGSITLNMDSAAAGDTVYLMFGRDAENAADTLNAVNLGVNDVWLEYENA